MRPNLNPQKMKRSHSLKHQMTAMVMTEQQTTPPSPNPEPPPSGPSEASEPNWDRIEAFVSSEAPEPSGDPFVDDAAQTIIPEEVISKEQFREGFVGVFHVGHRLSKLNALAIDGERVSVAHGAADALYETALDVSWLRWLISPGNKWVQRAFAMGAFAVPLGMATVAELRERQAVKGQTARRRPDDAKPPPDLGDAGAVDPSPEPVSMTPVVREGTNDA